MSMSSAIVEVVEVLLRARGASVEGGDGRGGIRSGGNS
jgi:hypothetical protein